MEGGSFDGVPFSVDKVSVLDCQYGEQYWKEKNNKQKRLRLQGTRKIGCHAHIKTHTYTLYPDFQVSPEEGKNLSKYNLRMLKEERLTVSAVREAIGAGKVRVDNKKIKFLKSIFFHYRGMTTLLIAD